MINKEIYKIWAPNGAKWVNWVRPVPFIEIGNKTNLYEVSNFEIPKINYMKKLEEDMAIIVDLDGNESIKEGLGLARNRL